MALTKLTQVKGSTAKKLVLREEPTGGALSAFYNTPTDYDWSDAEQNTALIESLAVEANALGVPLLMDLGGGIEVTALSASARDILKMSIDGTHLVTTQSTTIYPVQDLRNFSGKVKIPFTERFSPATFTKSENLYGSSIRFNELLEPAPGLKTYYVIGAAAGGGSTGGESIEDGFSQIQFALNQPDCGKIILISGNTYSKEDCEVTNYAIDHKLVIESLGGFTTLASRDYSLVWNLHSGSTYTLTLANSTRVVDKKYDTTYNFPHGNQFVDYFELEKLSSIAEVEATPGSYHISGSDIYVHCLDGRSPDDNLVVYRLIPFKFTGSAGAQIVVKDVIFEGFSNGFELWGEGEFYGKRSRFNFAGTSAADGGFKNKGWKSYTEYCGASRNPNDGFNYHADGTNKADAQEFRNFAFYNGNYTHGSSFSNKNASTSHDACQIVRVDCDYEGSRGPVVVDVLGCESFNLGVRAGGSDMATPENGTDRPFEFITGTTAYLWDCIGYDSSLGCVTDSTSRVYLRNCAFNGALGGTFSSYRQF